MNRLLSLLLVSLLTLAVCTRTFSRPTSDEETLKNLEMEARSIQGMASRMSPSRKPLWQRTLSLLIRWDIPTIRPQPTLKDGSWNQNHEPGRQGEK